VRASCSILAFTSHAARARAYSLSLSSGLLRVLWWSLLSRDATLCELPAIVAWAVAGALRCVCQTALAFERGPSSFRAPSLLLECITHRPCERGVGWHCLCLAECHAHTCLLFHGRNMHHQLCTLGLSYCCRLVGYMWLFLLPAAGGGWVVSGSQACAYACCCAACVSCTMYASGSWHV
jgi:hypothetical protein